MIDAKTIAERLSGVAQEIRSEADNLSPTNDVHPSGSMRRWSRTIDIQVAKLNPTK